MPKTSVSDLENQVQKFWSPMFEQELREQTLLPSLVSKKYQGEIKQGGDTVYVSQIIAPEGQTLDIGTDADTFSPEKLTTQRVSIQANKRFVASYEFEDLVDIQSQLGSKDSIIRNALLFSIEKQMNNYLYSLVNPSTSTPDHVLSGVSDMNKSQLSDLRVLAGQAQWLEDNQWYLLASPSFYGDLINDNNLSNRDFNGGDAPIVRGRMASQRFGFNIFEDNSNGILNLSPTSTGTDCALAFHPDFMHLVSGEPRFKISDKHPLNQFGYVISVDIIGGAALGNDGDKKHIQIYNS
jgi:hypothetical protein